MLHWRFTLEEYGTDIEYFPDKKDISKDALSQLSNNRNQDITHESTYLTETIPELYDIDELTDGTFPLYFNLIDCYQR